MPTTCFYRTSRPSCCRRDLERPGGRMPRRDFLRASVNGREVLRVDLRELAGRPNAKSGLTRRSGRIGLQAHTNTVRFRNVEIKELTASTSAAKSEFRSLFNGKDLSGWRTPSQPAQRMAGRRRRPGWFRPRGQPPLRRPRRLREFPTSTRGSHQRGRQ